MEADLKAKHTQELARFASKPGGGKGGGDGGGGGGGMYRRVRVCL